MGGLHVQPEAGAVAAEFAEFDGSGGGHGLLTARMSCRDWRERPSRRAISVLGPP